uniref:DUF1501 domain-containing protein n=1 Tax=Bursaphelenchus xylophilus TaxID=6326 RepID=A0A1I7RHG2_BURXY
MPTDKLFPDGTLQGVIPIGGHRKVPQLGMPSHELNQTDFKWLPAGGRLGMPVFAHSSRTDKLGRGYRKNDDTTSNLVVGRGLRDRKQTWGGEPTRMANADESMATSWVERVGGERERNA